MSDGYVMFVSLVKEWNGIPPRRISCNGFVMVAFRAKSMITRNEWRKSLLTTERRSMFLALIGVLRPLPLPALTTPHTGSISTGIPGRPGPKNSLAKKAAVRRAPLGTAREQKTWYANKAALIRIQVR